MAEHRHEASGGLLTGEVLPKVARWADLSYIMPMTSLSFLLGTILAKWFLHEQVSGWRWGVSWS